MHPKMPSISAVEEKPAWWHWAKKITPLRVARRWFLNEIYGDLRLFLLTSVGYIPSHRIRNFFYRQAGIQLPRSSSIHWRARFFSPENLRIGEHCTLGNDGFYDARDGITIGACTSIAGEVRIYTREHDIDDPHFAEIGGPVVIHDYVCIGSRVTILPRAIIGEGAVVASGAVVTDDVAPYTLVGGVPARFIRNRSRDLRYKLGYAKKFQ
jgi:putative colanic acid biosynthesis acetyltransferase WcaF